MSFEEKKDYEYHGVHHTCTPAAQRALRLELINSAEYRKWATLDYVVRGGNFEPLRPLVEGIGTINALAEFRKLCAELVDAEIVFTRKVVEVVDRHATEGNVE